MREFAFSRAESVSDAISSFREEPGAAYLAGGTTLIDLVKLDVMRPRQLVDLNRIGQASIETTASGGLKIGALVRNSDLARNSAVREKYPVLAEAILSGASSQLRNMATTGGNLLQRTRCAYFRDNISACNKREPGSGCAALEGHNRGHAVLGGSESCIATHPSDMCVGLAVLDAQVNVQGPDGARTIPFGDFHLLPEKTPERENALRAGELVTSVTLPPAVPGARSWYLKLRDRESFAFALASVAVLIVVEPEGGIIREARVALGGVATKPWRATAAEEKLVGQRPSEALFRAAGQAALREAQPRALNAFKVELATRLIVRALQTVSVRQPTVRTT